MADKIGRGCGCRRKMQLSLAADLLDAKADALAGAASNLYEMLDESCVNGPEAHALAAALAAFREGK